VERAAVPASPLATSWRIGGEKGSGLTLQPVHRRTVVPVRRRGYLQGFRARERMTTTTVPKASSAPAMSWMRWRVISGSDDRRGHHGALESDPYGADVVHGASASHGGHAYRRVDRGRSGNLAGRAWALPACLGADPLRDCDAACALAPLFLGNPVRPLSPQTPSESLTPSPLAPRRCATSGHAFRPNRQDRLVLSSGDRNYARLKPFLAFAWSGYPFSPRRQHQGSPRLPSRTTSLVQASRGAALQRPTMAWWEGFAASRER
jgi:hypothetical protein